MFWNKKQKGGFTGNMYSVILPPVKKEILIMRDLISDIQKYDEKGCIEVRNVLLTALSEQTEIFKIKKTNDTGRCS